MPRKASSGSSASSAPAAHRNRCTHPGCRKLAPKGRKRCDDHKPQPKAPAKLLGRTEPRLYTPPRRPLTSENTLGYEVIEFARIIGRPLLPWQEWVVIHALELKPSGGFRFRRVIVLVARQNGKSELARILTLWRMYMNPGTQVLGIAQELSLAKRQWEVARDLAQDTPELASELTHTCNTNGQEAFSLASGSTYRIKASNRRAGRGLSCDLVLIDELREHYDDDAWSAVTYTTMARPDAQIWAMSNAGDDRSVVLNRLREAALTGKDPATGLFEYSAPDGCDLADRQAWAQSNPALGYLIDEADIQSAQISEKPGIFRTEVLCQRVDQVDGAFDLAAWNECADKAGTLDAYRDRIAACIDVAVDGKHVTLTAGARLPGGRIRGEIVAAWDTTEACRADIDGYLDRIQPVEIGWFSGGPGTVLAAALAKRRGAREIKGSDVPHACMQLADLIQAREILHSDDPLLNAHIAGAQKLPTGDGWRITRRGGGHSDAAYAFAGMVHIALTMAEPQRARIRVLN